MYAERVSSKYQCFTEMATAADREITIVGRSIYQQNRYYLQSVRAALHRRTVLP
jgi:hypothetical protein